MFNFMCEYTGVSDGTMVAGKTLRKGIKTIVENVSREDLVNIKKAQENGWLKIHGAISFAYVNANRAMDIYRRSSDESEKKMILECAGKLVEEHKNDFIKNNDLEVFYKKESSKIVKEPVVKEPVVEEPVVEEPVVEEPVVKEPVVKEPVVEEPVVKEEPKKASKRESKSKA